MECIFQSQKTVAQESRWGCSAPLTSKDELTKIWLQENYIKGKSLKKTVLKEKLFSEILLQDYTWNSEMN